MEMGISFLEVNVRIFLIFCSLWALSGCSNFFAQTANKETDAAYYEDAVKYVNELEYDKAIEAIGKMSTGGQATKESRETLAGAYAGKCGLDFISFFQGIGSAGSAAFFKMFMSAFDQVSVDPASCTQAETIMKSFGSTASERTSDQNLFLAVLSMAKIGTYLRALADTDSTDNLGDGNMDTDFKVCDSTAPVTIPAGSIAPFYISDDNMKEVITGMALILQNITAVAAVLSGTSMDALSTFETTCAALPDSPCSATDTASVSANAVTAFRGLLATTSMGIGACGDSSGITCCPGN